MNFYDELQTCMTNNGLSNNTEIYLSSIVRQEEKLDRQVKTLFCLSAIHLPVYANLPRQEDNANFPTQPSENCIKFGSIF